MTARPLEIAAFLELHGWNDAQTQALDGDFSTRRYARLVKNTGQSAFLMDADAVQKTPQFILVATVLRGLGLKAPVIYADDAPEGLVLMEDLGTRNVGALLDAGEPPLPYLLRAVEVLAKLHRDFNKEHAETLNLPVFDTKRFADQVELFLDSYFPVSAGREASEEERQEFRAAWETILQPLESLPQSLLLRDFMPDNLMDLPDGSLGLLDFQDAGVGPVAYDLASLCEEVRRDGGITLLPDVITHYIKESQSSLSHADLLQACTVLSAQRHMRVLGIIVRLSKRTGQCNKFRFLPRIRQHLERILNEPYLLPIKQWTDNFDGLLQ
jgi:aminoglycoside/choline kinase family phosphotransferase